MKSKIIWIILISCILVGAIFTFSLQAMKQKDLERELIKIKNQEDFCSNLKYDIKAPPKIGMGYLDLTLSLCSSSKDNGEIIVYLKDGSEKVEQVYLSGEGCAIQQFNGISYSDVDFIEMKSPKCSGVKDIVTDVEQIKPR